jgi:predicted nuclease of restriction endonuclease-like (RecB) superfamily
LYWNLGKQILELQKKTSWGDKFLQQLAKDLQKEFPNSSGYSYRNLKYMRVFARENEEFVIGQSLTAQISWTHNMLLLDRCKDKTQRLWYAENSIKYGWSVRVLDHQIDAQQYERSGKSINNFAVTLPAPQSELARDILKDPYNFDFLTLEKDFAEKDLEEALVKHITSFLLELGVGFAFVGRQYVVTVDDTDYKIDLLFYHLKLRCYVVIELKAKDFQPEFAGKLNFYINVIDGEVKDKTDNPTIGILLCKNKGGNTKVEYSLKNINAPISISGYTVSNALPSVETLQRELENVIIENEKEQGENQENK